MDATLRALNRFGLGARIGERARISDPRAWLRDQLSGPAPQLDRAAVPSKEAIGAALRGLRAAGQATPQERQAARRVLNQIATNEATAALSTRVTTERPFVERLVAFWSNHLCISTAGKQAVSALAGVYEREAIRPHVLGRFEDMVLASAKHPAMLVYLDNAQSVGPTSPGARAGRRGLNENYARELLELHTVGVSGGYTQQDVQELARILTGWTVAGVPGIAVAQARPRAQGAGDESIGFAFQPLLHEPGAKTVLGVRYEEAGVAEGERVIRALCRHSATADFVAGKLVAHFVSDTPPPSAVSRIAKVFRDSEGDLRAVSLALVELPEAWEEGTRKFRTPQDWLVAVFRAVGGGGNRGPALVPSARQLRHPLWAPLAPKGFSDLTADWADPDSLLNRAELARTLGPRLAVASDPRGLLTTVDVSATDPLHRILSDSSIPPAERLALAIAGPAFHWR